MSSRTLVIIDMQEEFEAASHDHTLNEIEKQIGRARLYDWPVLLVEYRNRYGAKHQRTVTRLRDLLKGYRKCHQVIKDDDDGSVEVMAAALTHKVDLDTVRFCGVNSDCCVADTVKGLLDYLPQMQVELVRKGCNSEDGYGRVPSHLRSIKRRRKNVRII